MAPPKKVIQTCTCKPDIDAIKQELEELRELIAELTKPRVASIQRTETFNGEFPIEQSDDMASRFSYEERIQNMRNAAAILPPNLIVDGRHTLENINAIMCFNATEEMMDDLYSQYSHSE